MMFPTVTYPYIIRGSPRWAALGLSFLFLTLAPAAASAQTSLPHNIPDLCAIPTVTASRSGPWSNPATWSGNRLPTPLDVVAIPAGITVTFDTLSGEAGCLGLKGTLAFQRAASTKLRVTTLMVMPGGTLEIGSPSNPLPVTVTAEVVIRDVPLNTGTVDLATGRYLPPASGVPDPEQFGNGLVGLGKVTMHGAPRSPTFIRLATEPKQGDTTLTLFEPAIGWQPGDPLVLPDTRQDRISGSQLEQVTLAGVSQGGLVLTLTSALQFNHLGARDGDGTPTALPDGTRLMPHVANLTRNVVVRSENPAGTRGHVMLTHRAEADVRYAQFKDLGRTTTDQPLDSTTFDLQGNVTHVGTNPKGRYALHAHHLYGPVNPTNTGYQFQLVGNAVSDSTKWPITIHDSHYGLVKGNVVFNGLGAGMATETGNESFNVIERNLVVRTSGNGTRTDNGGTAGSSYWLHSLNNHTRDNVATNAGGATSYTYGFNLFLSGSVAAGGRMDRRIPLFRGADTTVQGEYQVVDMTTLPILEFARNETYGVMNGMSWWDLGMHRGQPQPLPGPHPVKDLRVWHFGWLGIFNYPTHGILLDGFVVRGEYGNPGSLGFNGGDYEASGLVIRGADIQNVSTGIKVSPNSGSPNAGIQRTQTVENSTFRNTGVGILVKSYWGNLPRPPDPRVVILRNNTFVARRPGQPVNAVVMDGTTTPGAQKDEIWFVDTAGTVSRLFFKEQDPNHPSGMLPSGGGLMGVPPPGDNLTNQQAWDKYGIAAWGELATCNTTRSDIGGGFICPATAVPASFDQDPPVRVSPINASAVGSDIATIAWDTDEPAASLVLYGPTLSYGSAVATLTFGTAQQVVLTGLTADTTYNYRVYSKDQAGNWSQTLPSQTGTFLTSTASGAARLVITSPVPNASLTGASVPVTYQSTGDLSVAAHVHLKLDTLPEVQGLPFNGKYTFQNVPAGSHTLTGSLADSAHRPVPGTTVSVVLQTTIPSPSPSPSPTPTPTPTPTSSPTPTPTPTPTSSPTPTPTPTPSPGTLSIVVDHPTASEQDLPPGAALPLALKLLLPIGDPLSCFSVTLDGVDVTASPLLTFLLSLGLPVCS